ncbi:hypothetical protein EHR01_11045 [Leptospira mtsangambouensis]|uniref:Carboxypeptidase regulatory-like domain-containing protein n=1 Tax=Leptospira mtsangambouensis TaxID=2484912 RepID=A0ABY2NY28_9LEPT|nr:hypothetical protein [Leptospira mtsangambouensis]TGM74045.1 hypothetical protein EHR01_11045 [Leptospira mtsangambouensis]
MKFNKLFPLMILIFIAVGCKSIPTQNPAAKDSSVLAVEVSVKQFLGSKSASRVHVVRVDKKVNPGQTLITKTPVIASNWSDRGVIYYLNVEPGEYVVVAFEYEVEQQAQQTSSTTSGNVTVTTSSGGGKTIFTVITNKETAEKSKTKVAAGQLAYMGSFLVDTNKDFAEADEIQKHYANILKPGMLEKTGLFGNFFSVDLLGTLVSFTKDEEKIKEFKEDSKKSFAETPWSYLTEK